MTARRALTRRRDPRETVDPDAETTLRSALAEAATLDQVLDVLLPYADDPAMRSTATSAGYAKLREIRTADPRSRDKALARLRRLDVATGWAYTDTSGRRRPVRHDAAQSLERCLLRRLVLLVVDP